MDQKTQFIADYLRRSLSITERCEHYGISRKSERRYRAHQHLGRPTITAIITKGNSDEIALIENIQREDLSPIDQAEGLVGMMERHGYKQEELAKIVGKSRPTVTELSCH